LDKSPTTEQPGATDKDPRAGKRAAWPEKLTSLRQKLGHKAKQEPKFRFYALYDRIYRRDVLWAAWVAVQANGGSAGVDGVTIGMIEASEDGAMQVVEQLHEEFGSLPRTRVPVGRCRLLRSRTLVQAAHLSSDFSSQ
jgi:RNA-directed DNA polymerase